MERQSRSLDEGERLSWLRLIRSENVGPATFWNLLKRYGNAKDALKEIPDLARRGGLKRRIRICSTADAESEIAAADKIGARFIACIEPDYPDLLTAIDAPPPVICIRGHPVLFGKRLIALVGARNASAAGRRFAHDLAYELGQRGLVVVSGLARGIDTATHKGALSTGTVAVLAGGVDAIYPKENTELYTQIAEAGVIVSETPLGVTAGARDFPRRNRLISGMCLGTVVVEASVKSGSLITARYAGEQGRDVFAVPGSPLDPRSKGTNSLIRQGAILIENADHVLDELDRSPLNHLSEPVSPDGLTGTEPRSVSLSEDELQNARTTVLGLLSPTPTNIDEVIRQSTLAPAVVHTVLLELDLAARLERHIGGSVSLV